MGSLLEGLYANSILLHLRLSSEDSIRYFVHVTGEIVYGLVLWPYFLVKIPLPWQQTTKFSPH